MELKHFYNKTVTNLYAKLESIFHNEENLYPLIILTQYKVLLQKCYNTIDIETR